MREGETPKLRLAPVRTGEPRKASLRRADRESEPRGSATARPSAALRCPPLRRGEARAGPRPRPPLRAPGPSSARPGSGGGAGSKGSKGSKGLPAPPPLPRAPPLPSPCPRPRCPRLPPAVISPSPAPLGSPPIRPTKMLRAHAGSRALLLGALLWRLAAAGGYQRAGGIGAARSLWRGGQGRAAPAAELGAASGRLLLRGALWGPGGAGAGGSPRLGASGPLTSGGLCPPSPRIRAGLLRVRKGFGFPR